jgi:hypothetical protein
MKANLMNSSLNSVLSDEERVYWESLTHPDQTAARAARRVRVLLHAGKTHAERQRGDELAISVLVHF